MDNRIRANVLDCYIDTLDTDGAMAKVAEFIAARKPRHVITLNAEIVYLARKNKELKDIINQADLVTPDGIGIVWAARKLGWGIKERVTGIDMVNNICSLASQKGWGIYLLGAHPTVVEKAAGNLRQHYPQLKIVGTRDGYFTEKEIPPILEDIKKSSPDILLVALGAPKQEFFISKYKGELGIPVSVGVGGSFDVIAEVKKRAPEFMIKLNLEWFYRLITEPSRIRRQLVLPKFVMAVLRQGKKRV
ncbi:MAG TPA: WecB/TagA/CpsF family glycosyltransferase [Syntrophomonadaceae bacterium]|nr:WecB/TagA/CpsF family glycosyltransferase [Syntrophomonadaceae bacterium]